MSRHGYNYPPPHMQSRADYGGDRRRSDHFEPPRGPPDYDDRDLGPLPPPQRQWGRVEYDERISYPDERDRNWDDDRMWNRPPPGPPLDPWRPTPEQWDDRQDSNVYWDHRSPMSPAPPRGAPYDYYQRDQDGYRERVPSWGVPPPPIPPGATRDDVYRGGWSDEPHMRPGEYNRDYPPPPPPAVRNHGNFRGNGYNNTRGGRGQRGRLRAIDNYKPYKQQSTNFIPMSRPAPRTQRDREIRSRSVSRTRTRSRSRSRSDRGDSRPSHDDSRLPSRHFDSRRSRSRSHSRSGSRSRSQSHAAPSRSLSAKAPEVSRPPSAQGSSIGSSRPSSPGRMASSHHSANGDAVRKHSPEATTTHPEAVPAENGQHEPSPVPGLAIPGLNSSSPVMSPAIPTTSALDRTIAGREPPSVPVSSSQDVSVEQPTITPATATGRTATTPEAVPDTPNTPAVPSASLPRTKANGDAPPTTPPPHISVFGSPRARPADADSVQYLTIGREPYLPFLDEEYAPPSDENLFPSDDNAFWRPEWSSAPFLATLHDSVKHVHALPPETIRARVDAVLKTNRAVLDTGNNRLGTDDEESEDDILASHKKLLPVFRGRVSEAQSSQHRKVEALKAEYRQRHAKWLIHCAELDKLKSLPPEKGGPPDLPTHVGRNTRRNAQLGTLGDTVRTEFEMEQIMASLGNEDMTDPNQLYQRNIAHIPDMISLQSDFFEYQYDDTNGYVENPHEFYDELKGNLDHWTEEEEEIFKQKFAEFPKQFGAIAAALPNKTPEECVVFYYVTKRERIDFRKVLQTYGTRRRGRGGRKSVAGNKGGALLADIQKTRRKATPPPVAPPAPAPQAETSQAATDGRRQSGRQRTTAAKARAAEQESSEESSEEPTPPPRRKGGRPSNAARAAAAAAAVATAKAAESPAATPPADNRKKIMRNKAKEIEDAYKRKTVSSYWSVGEKAQFLDLVRRLGKNFHAIAELMPEKSVLQVGNYYKTHAETLGLDAIAAQAPPPILPPNTFIQNGLQYQIVPISGLSSHPWIPDPLQGTSYGPPPI